MYTRLQRTVAVLYGVLCHTGFAAGIGAMMLGIYSGLSLGRGPFHGVSAILVNLCLLIQFPALHSFLLSPRGTFRNVRQPIYRAFTLTRYCRLVPRWLPGLRPLTVQMLNHTGES